MGVSKIRGTLLGGPHNKDGSVVGSTFGSPYLGKLPRILYSMQSPDIMAGCRVLVLVFWDIPLRTKTRIESGASYSHDSRNVSCE